VVGPRVPTTLGMLGSLTARAAAALAIAVAAIAPGSPSAAQTQAPGVALRELVDAVARWDVQTICGRMSSAKLAEVVRGFGVIDDERLCVKALEGDGDAKELLQEDLADLASLRTVAVDVHGRRARVVYDYDNRDARLTVRASARLMFERGGWKVDDIQDAPPRVGREYLFQMPSGSMEPTVRIGAWILVDPRPYRTAGPVVGDIVVLRPPAGFVSYDHPCGAPRPKGQACAVAKPGIVDTYVVKRVVGLPGDRLSIRHGRVVRNGVPERADSLKPCGHGRGCELPRAFTVRRGTYYVVGDNRGESDDSRFWGPVAKRSILGRVRVIKR
jgi:signal peptidase I